MAEKRRLIFITLKRHLKKALNTIIAASSNRGYEGDESADSYGHIPTPLVAAWEGTAPQAGVP
jgi:hypothetical protein